MIDGDEVKRQAQAGQMGEQLYAVVFKRRVDDKDQDRQESRFKWERGYRAPRSEDDTTQLIIATRLAEKCQSGKRSI